MTPYGARIGEGRWSRPADRGRARRSWVAPARAAVAEYEDDRAYERAMAPCSAYPYCDTCGPLDEDFEDPSETPP